MFPWNKAKLPYEFESDYDGFSICFPRKPKPEVNGFASKYTARSTSGGIAYRVVIKYDYIDNTDSLDKKPAEMLERLFLKKTLDSLQDGEKRGIVSVNNEGVFMGKSCADTVYQQPGSYTVAKYFIKGGNLFHILVANRKKETAENQFSLFIDSFKFIDNKF
jgi:hypothetical protein